MSQEGKLEEQYIEKPNEIIDIPEITENMIVYEADEKWKPMFIKDNPILNNYLQESVYFGEMGQKAFRNFASHNKLLIQEIEQTQESFEDYKKANPDIFVKRADYILLNCNGCHVEVKSRTFYEREGTKTVSLKYSELMGLKRMQDLLNTKIVICIFEIRDNNLVNDKVYSISIDRVLELKKNGDTIYHEKGKFIEIPVNSCDVGINGLKNECML